MSRKLVKLDHLAIANGKWRDGCGSMLLACWLGEDFLFAFQECPASFLEHVVGMCPARLLLHVPVLEVETAHGFSPVFLFVCVWGNILFVFACNQCGFG